MYNSLSDLFSDIADSIRLKAGTSSTIQADAFKSATNWSYYSSRFSVWNGID